MPAFPSLSVTPSISGWTESIRVDPTIRTPVEAGYQITRPRFTRSPRRWEIAYAGGNALPLADKNILSAFESSVKVGSDIITWTNPVDSVAYQVRLAGPIQYRPLANKLYWEVRMLLEEV